MRTTVGILSALVFATTTVPTNATAQLLFDHMKCYKVKDQAKFKSRGDADRSASTV